MAITPQRLGQMLNAYIVNDAESADPAYVRDVLRDVCGMTKDEAEELGLLWIYGKEEE